MNALSGLEDLDAQGNEIKGVLTCVYHNFTRIVPPEAPYLGPDSFKMWDKVVEY